MTFTVGDRVRLTAEATERLGDFGEGTVKVINEDREPFPVEVGFDGDILGANDTFPLNPDEIELIEPETNAALELKNAALTMAAFVFRHYSELHLAKGTDESSMKAITNIGLERMMLDALDAD